MSSKILVRSRVMIKRGVMHVYIKGTFKTSSQLNCQQQQQQQQQQNEDTNLSKSKIHYKAVNMDSVTSSMDFSEINSVSKLENILPTKKMSELDVNADYMVSSLTTVNTKYGSSIVAAINNEYTLYLPTRIVNALEKKPELFEAMNRVASEGHLYLRYLGGKYNKCEFFDKMN